MPVLEFGLDKNIVGSVGRRYPCIPDVSECPRWILAVYILIAYNMKLC